MGACLLTFRFCFVGTTQDFKRRTRNLKNVVDLGNSLAGTEISEIIMFLLWLLIFLGIPPLPVLAVESVTEIGDKSKVQVFRNGAKDLPDLSLERLKISRRLKNVDTKPVMNPFEPVPFVQSVRNAERHDKFDEITSLQLRDHVTESFELRDLLSNSSEAKAMYWAGNLEDVFDIERWKDQNENIRRRAWISSRHVLATLHYDSSDNLFTQIHGRKYVLILPPSKLHEVQLYPSLSARYRQSQRAALDWRSVRNTSDLQILSLDPGDQIFIPAFHFHQIEPDLSNDFTVSVNFWMRHPLTRDLESIFESPIPVEAHWSQSKQLNGVCVYFGFILESMKLERCGFARNFTSSRFGTTLMRNALQTIDSDLPTFDFMFFEELFLSDDEVTKIRNRANHPLRILTKPDLDFHVGILYLEDYMEEVGFFFTKSVHLISPFILQCHCSEVCLT